MWHKMLLFLFICLVFACQPAEKKIINTAFYHWQTELIVNDLEQSVAEQLQVKKLYVKFFDIDWNAAQNTAIPKASVQIDTTYLSSMTIVPTIFITNRTFKNIAEKDVADLAKKVGKKILALAKQIPEHKINEVQIDCDWSEMTRANYWHFLEILQEEYPAWQLSATIRLHQIKYVERTGIPPVDRGTLMFYNMGNLDDWESENSIIDLSIARQYLDKLPEYQLPLDIALPLFRWGVVYRDHKMVRLFNQLTVNDLSDTSRFIFLTNNRYQVKKSTYLNSIYLYEKDKIRLENCTPNALRTAAIELGQLLPTAKRDLIFYHLEEEVLQHYSVENLGEIIEQF